MVLDRHDDQAVGLLADAVDLAEDAGHGVGVEVYVACPGVATGCRR